MSSNVHIAMLGTGFIAEFTTQVYQRLQGVKVVSVLGRDLAGEIDRFLARAFSSHTVRRDLLTVSLAAIDRLKETMYLPNGSGPWEEYKSII